jgi:hypothetical protein
MEGHRILAGIAAVSAASAVTLWVASAQQPNHGGLRFWAIAASVLTILSALVAVVLVMRSRKDAPRPLSSEWQGANVVFGPGSEGSKIEDSLLEQPPGGTNIRADAKNIGIFRSVIRQRGRRKKRR